MFKRLVEWIKGPVRVQEVVRTLLTYEGVVPAFRHWPSEPYRFHVWVFDQITRRDAGWVKPVIRPVFVVDPMTRHQLPTDVRSRTIFVMEPMGKQRYEGLDHPEEAVQACLTMLQEARSAAYTKKEA